MKICKDCKIKKDLLDFYGKQTKCKQCTKIDQKRYYIKNKIHITNRNLVYQRTHKESHRKSNKKYCLNNKEKRLVYQRKYRSLNKARLLARDRLYNEKNRLKCKEQESKWRSLNRGHYNASKAKRRIAKLNRTPKWLTALDWEKIKEYYIYAQLFSETLGIQYDVDHIIPLQGKNISGLHCPENLQILTAKENAQKRNTFPY
jgi:hypothetical protein